MICGGAVAAMYIVKLLLPTVPIPDVGLYSGATGLIALAIGAYTFFGTHPEDITENARLDYLITLALFVTVVSATGSLDSPFILLWGAVALAAPLFGAWGLLPAILIAVGGPLFLMWTGAAKADQAITSAAIGGILPLLGMLLKPSRNTALAETNEDKSYHALATELSQVAGKSEVVINAIGEGVLAVDGQGTIQLINPSALRQVGWNKEDALGLNYKSILQLVDSRNSELDSAHDPVAKTFASNAPTGPDEFTLVTQSGKNILVTVLVSPVGQPGSGAIIVFRDVTREKAEERQQAEFISTASHEMRTPVASIEGYLGLALNPQTANVDDKARDYIGKAHAAAQHLGRLFQDLLDVSKAEDGRMQNNPKVVDVTKFMADVVEGLRPKAEEKGLKLVYKPLNAMLNLHEKGIGRTVAPSFYVTVDNDHLREVADNLVENAIKYTPSGEVSVDVTGNDQHVIISITDTGLGIPKEDQPHLFQKFYRVDNTETREIGGTGLGLYLCRRLVEGMNGRIWADSVFKKGSTFNVELPRTSGVDANTMIQQAEKRSEAQPIVPANIPNIDTPVAQPLADYQGPPATDPMSSLPSDQLLDLIVNDTPEPAPAPQQQPVIVQTPPPTPMPTPTAAPVMPAPQPVPTATLPAAPSFKPVLTEVPTTPAPETARIPRPIDEFPNVQLSAIEKDPSRYIAQTEGRAINIPKRTP